MGRPKSNNSDNMSKIIVSFPKDTLEKITELAKENGMNRSAMINYAIKWYLDYKNSMDMMPMLLDLVKMEPEKLKERTNKLSKDLK